MIGFAGERGASEQQQQQQQQPQKSLADVAVHMVKSLNSEPQNGDELVLSSWSDGWHKRPLQTSYYIIVIYCI